LAVQGAWAAAGEPGYFFPRNTNAFLALETGTQKCDPCVPYYVYHKSLAGLIDIAARLGDARARAAAIGMGDWAVARVAGVLAGGGQAVWQSVLNTEWGGMNDALNNLFRLTGDARYLNTASAFNHWAWTAPLAVHEDELQSFHANTHIPEVMGDLNGFSLTQNATQGAIVRNFLDILFANHTWATGGSNDHEWWGPPRAMLAQLNPDTEETCTQYNIAKVTSALGTLDGDPKNFDWTERQLWNGMLGNQHLGGQWADTDSTGFHYMLPLGGAELRKPWGDSSEGFPCCWGTSVEQFAGRHLELPFAEAPDHGTLFVNLFMPVTLTWRARGNLTVAQAAGFPASTSSTTRLTIGGGGGGAAAAQTFTLAVRVPSWAKGANAVTLNGSPLPAPAPVAGTYLSVTRAWASGDVLDAYFPLALAWEPVVDDSAEAAGVGAVLFGPILLAAVGARSDLAPNHDMGGGPGRWVTRLPNETALRFSFAGPFGACGSGDAALDMMPLHDVRFPAGFAGARAQRERAAPRPRAPRAQFYLFPATPTHRRLRTKTTPFTFARAPRRSPRTGRARPRCCRGAKTRCASRAARAAAARSAAGTLGRSTSPTSSRPCRTRATQSWAQHLRTATTWGTGPPGGTRGRPSPWRSWRRATRTPESRR